MNSIVNAMPKYNHRQHVLSDCLAELDQRFQLGEVDEDTNRITWCQLLIGATGSGILTRLGIGSVRDEAWAALKSLKKGIKDIVELAGKAEKLNKRLHPRDEEAAERHAVDAFLGALEKNLAMEVQKLGHRTMEEVVAAARRIEKILEEQTHSKMEHLVNSMQDHIQILKKDLREANEQIATHKAAPPSAAMAAIPAPASTVAAAAQAPPTAPARHIDHDYGDEINLPSLPRRLPRCFLCGEEVHVAANCPARPILQRLLQQQACTSAHNPPQGPIRELPTTKDDSPPGPKVQLNLLEESPEAKVTPVGCAVGPPITGQLNLDGIPVLGASVTCMGFSVWWQYHTQRGLLKPFEGVVHGAHGKPLQIAGKTQHLNLQWAEARGGANFIVIIGLELTPRANGNGHYEASTSPYRCHSWYCHACPARSTDDTPQHRQTATPPASHALLLQAVDIPAETAQLVHCHNPWPSEDVYFCPEESLPTFVSGVPAFTSGSEVWVAIHNHRPGPLRLHTGQTVGTLEIVALADSPPSPPTASQNRQPPVPEHLSPAQQPQLKALLQEFSDIISQGEDDLGCTPLLQHTIETEGTPLRQPYCRQNPAVRREEMAQVRQMLSSGVVRPSNSPGPHRSSW